MTDDEETIAGAKDCLRAAIRAAMADAEHRGLIVADLIDVLSDIRDELDERLFEGEV